MNFAQIAIDHLHSLPIKWKADEWTVYAAVLDCLEGKVVAMGTGVKCVPDCKLTRQGCPLPLYYDTVRDMHAEVVCRRAFVKYLLVSGKRSKYAFYVTKAPCGDASMPTDAVGQWAEPASRPNDRPAKRLCGRGRENFKLTGIVRTKPARADAPPTLSVSCSDKMALWSVLGCQGAVLRERIVFDHMVIDDPDACLATVSRGLKERVGLGQSDLPNIVVLDTRLFKFGHWSGLSRPSPVSHVWFEGIDKVQVIVDGRRLGSKGPAGNGLPKSSQTCISTASLYRFDHSATIEEVWSRKAENEKYQADKASLFERHLLHWPRLRTHTPLHGSAGEGGKSGRSPGASPSGQ